MPNGILRPILGELFLGGLVLFLSRISGVLKLYLVLRIILVEFVSVGHASFSIEDFRYYYVEVRKVYMALY